MPTRNEILHGLAKSIKTVYINIREIKFRIRTTEGHKRKFSFEQESDSRIVVIYARQYKTIHTTSINQFTVSVHQSISFAKREWQKMVASSFCFLYHAGQELIEDMINLIWGSLCPRVANHVTAFRAHITGNLIRTIAQFAHSLMDPLFSFLGNLCLFIQYFGDCLIANTSMCCNLLQRCF